jgi:hypothetical protein
MTKSKGHFKIPTKHLVFLYLAYPHLLFLIYLTISLTTILELVQPRRGDVDRRRWVAHEAGYFTVKSAYISLLHNLL